MLTFEKPTYSTNGGSGGGGSIVGQNGWSQSAGNPDGGEITTEIAYAGSQSFFIHRDDSGNQTRFGRGGFTDINGQTGGSVDFYFQATRVDLTANVLFYFGTSTTDTNAAAVFGMQGDEIRYYNGGTAISTTDANLVAGVWYHYTAVFNFDSPTRTYDLTVQSVGLNPGEPGYVNRTLSDLAFRNQAVNDIHSVMVLSEMHHVAPNFHGHYIDNLSFNAVSKPGSHALINFSGSHAAIRDHGSGMSR